MRKRLALALALMVSPAFADVLAPPPNATSADTTAVVLWWEVRARMLAADQRHPRQNHYG